MQKAIRNISGKPTTPEALDRRDAARQQSSKPINAAPAATDSKAKAIAYARPLDQQYDANRIAQAKAEKHQGTSDAAKGK